MPLQRVIALATTIFGRSYAAEADLLTEQLKQDGSPSRHPAADDAQPAGVDYNAHVLEAILTNVAPLGYR